MSQSKEIEVRKTPPANILVFGGLIGAGAGVVAAMLLRRRAKKQARESTITATEAIQLGLLLFGLFRAIASLGDDDK
jgi:hypothetical protein